MIGTSSLYDGYVGSEGSHRISRILFVMVSGTIASVVKLPVMSLTRNIETLYSLALISCLHYGNAKTILNVVLLRMKT